MTQELNPGLGELLRHLTELVDRGAAVAYGAKALEYRLRYTPVMRALADGRCSISDITTQLAITQGAVSQTIKLMILDGLVTRTPGSDARRSIVSLTDKGSELLRVLCPHWQATFDAVQGLEDEIGIPLRSHLSNAISVLDRLGFAERIDICEQHEKSGLQTPGLESPSRIQGHFQQGGEAYAQNRPAYPPELAQLLVKSCMKRQLAIDVGCGSGQLSLLLADHFNRVIATDVSADQLAFAQARSNLCYKREAAEVMSAADGSADLIVAAQAAHWFDLTRFYSECRRVGKAGAVIALVSYGVPYIEGALNARFQRFYWQRIATFWPAGRHHVETGYSELPFPFEALPSTELFIHRDWDVDSLLGYLKTWSAYRCAVKEGEGEIFNQFAGELMGFWGEHDSLKRITWPISVRLGRV